MIEDPKSTTNPKDLLNAQDTLESLKSFLLNESVFQNFILLVISQAVILFLCVFNLVIFLCYVRDNKTTRFAKNNILLFTVIVFLCCIWNIVNLISNCIIHREEASTIIAIKGENGAVGGRLNDLFGFLRGGSGAGLGGIVSEWVYGDGRCGDLVTEDLFFRIYFPFDRAFFGSCNR